MRLESGTCNVCSAPCSSCMHLNHALMGSGAEEFSDENCQSEEGNVYSVSSRACENLQHNVSETSNMLSVNSSHDSLSENAESRRLLLDKYQDSKHLEGHDDNTSCISKASDANLVSDCMQRNASEVNVPCSSASVSHLEAEGSRSTPSVDMPGLEIPSSKDADTSHSSQMVQRLCGQSKSGTSLSGNPSSKDVERGSDSHMPEKLSECNIVNSCSSLTKEREPVVTEDNLIDSTANVSLKVCPKSESDTDVDVCDAKGDDRKYLVHDGQPEKAEELVKSPGKQEPQSEDESDESDVIEHDVKVCDICGDAGREDLLAICCRCTDGAEHTYCMREMLEKLPEGDWFCEECVDAEEAENKRRDVEENKIIKGTSTSQVSGKRLSDNIEVAPPAAKRQALELSTGSPKVPSPKRLVPPSRESSFKSLDKLKGKPGLIPIPMRNHSGDDTALELSTGSPKVPSPKRLVPPSRESSFKILDKLKGKPGLIPIPMRNHSGDDTALELSTGSPKVPSPKRLVPPSRESSFKSLDKLKGKPGLIPLPMRNHSGDDTEIARSPSITPRGQISKSMLLKSNSSNNLNSKQRVKLVDEVFPPRLKGGNEHTSKNVETPARMTNKSTLFKSSSLGRSSATESKVKMLSPKSAAAQDLKGSRHLREPGALDRKFMSRHDWPVASSVVSTPKGDQKLTPRGETIKPSAVSNTRELRVNQEGKLSASSKSTSISRKSMEPQVSSERTPTSIDEARQDVPPRSRDTVNQVEKSRESFSVREKPVVPTTSKSPFCKKCKEFGHSLEYCTAGTTQESGAEMSATSSSISKEEMHKGNSLKAAIQAALLKRPEIYRKKEVTNQTGEVSTPGTELNCEVTSQDQVLVSSISAEGTHEQRGILENSTSDSSKCSSVSDLKQLNSCPTDLCSKPGKSESVGLNAQKPLVREFADKDVATSSAMSVFPEYEYIWQGVFEVHRNGKSPDLCTGVQAHLSSCASPKVLEVVAKFLPKVPLNEVSRLSTWPSQFHHGGAREDNIALYFFARDVESYERHYKGILDHMIRNDLALKGIFDGVELLIFPSNQLPENSQRWNMLFFLWGVFRGRTNHSDSAKKICIPSLNAMPVEENSSTAVVSLSENCSSKYLDEKSINCDKAFNALPPSTSIDQCQITAGRNDDISCQTQFCSQVKLEKLDSSRTGNKSTPMVPITSTLLCQPMKSTGSSQKASILEDGQCRESKHPEAMGTSVINKMLEAKTDSHVEQENNLSSEIPSVSNQEIDAASNISKDGILDRIDRDEDQQRSKRKQVEDCHCIDLEETIDNQETSAASSIGKDKTSERMNIDEDQQRPKRKQKNHHYIDLEATVENQETGAAINMTKDKISVTMDVDEDQHQQWLKRKAKNDNYIDLEATFQEDLSVEGIKCQLPNDKEVHVDLSDTVMQPPAVSCQKMPWNEVNGKLEGGDSSSQKLKTGFGGIHGCYSSGGRDSFNDTFTSLGNDLGSCSSVGDKGYVEASDEKIIREDLGTMERTFFPVGTQNISDPHLVLNSMSVKGLHHYEDGIPNLELALGGDTKLPPLPPPPPPVTKGMLPFLVGPIDRKDNHPDGLEDGQEDGVAASLSLSLSVPSSNKEHTKAELLPDRHRVNSPLLLFGRYKNK